MKARIRHAALLLLVSTALTAETIQFKADSMTGNTGSGQEATVLSGRAWIQTDDIEINAEQIELTGSEYDKIVATGNVSGVNTSAGTAFSADRLTYDRKTDIIRFEGNVTLTDTENDVTASAYLIEFNQKTQSAILQMNVRLVRKDSVCTSALATWRKEEKMLEMTGSPKIVQKDDTFTAQEIIFNLDTEEITLDGKVRGSVTDDSDKDKTSDSQGDSQ